MERYQGAKYQRQLAEMIDELDEWAAHATLQLEAWKATRTRGKAPDKLLERQRWVHSALERLEQAHSALKRSKQAGE